MNNDLSKLKEIELVKKKEKYVKKEKFIIINCKIKSHKYFKVKKS